MNKSRSSRLNGHKKVAIIEAACKLFSENGYPATTFEDISDQASQNSKGYSKLGEY